nr:MAG TPA: hypothetical protein [Caudoviricetes sp.]
MSSRNFEQANFKQLNFTHKISKNAQNLSELKFDAINLSELKFIMCRNLNRLLAKFKLKTL